MMPGKILSDDTVEQVIKALEDKQPVEALRIMRANGLFIKEARIWMDGYNAAVRRLAAHDDHRADKGQK